MDSRIVAERFGISRGYVFQIWRGVARGDIK